MTGGIGAGKSELLRAFARHGAAVLSSDEIVHRLLREDGAVKRAVVERFGDRVLDGAGEIDRARVAEIVFADRDALAWLEALVHPRVLAAYEAWRQRLAGTNDPPAVCVIEVPLLYEVGAEPRFDAVAVVTAPRRVRAARVRRPLEERERRLLPDDEKVARADFAYVNDGSLADLDAFASDVLAKLTCAGH
ncbi:MAG TPA: dephospho-CoA kinase [Gaiellaceae bacterium]|nr:dephospho-CoA kinase [Gaiellaceae bacterium]